MDSIPGDIKTDRSLHPAEHYLFQAHGRWLLFNVNTLTVINSCLLDKEILDSAVDGSDSQRILEKVILGGISRQKAAERIKTLIDHRFLLPFGEMPCLAKLSAPTEYATFMVNVSQRCNLTCSYCYVNKGFFDYNKEPPSIMPASIADSLVERIFENFSGFGTYAFHFYGGEPLMNFNAIRRIVLSAGQKGAAAGKSTEYHITTNGTLLNREIADFMDEHRFTVYLSVDGGENIHDEVRKYANGRGSYRDIEKNLAYLRTKPGVHLIGSSVVRKGLSLGGAIEQLENIGARQCKAERVRLHDGEDLSLTGEEYESYLQDIAILSNHYIKHLSSGQKPADFRLTSKILQLLTKTRRNFFCPAGERMFGISGDGELYPCALHVGRPGSKLGDLWSGVDRIKQQEFNTRFNLENQEDCRTCWTRHLCGGGCSAMIDRFSHEDCRSLRAESEAAIAVYMHFAEDDPVKLYGLVSPKLVKWIDGESEDPFELDASRLMGDKA